MMYRHYILWLFVLQLVNAQCINSLLADSNEDGELNVIDVLATVDVIISLDAHSQEEISLFDINTDDLIDILDVLKLVHKILQPYPSESHITSIESTLFELDIQWESSSDHTFSHYELYISSTEDDTDREFLFQTTEQQQTTTSITGLSLYNDNWFWVDVVDYWGCATSSQSYKIDYFEKEYTVDESGHIVNTEMVVEDFAPSTSCVNCHETHVEEWADSRHGHAMKDPVFFQMWNDEQQRHPATGERFCVQCHSPVAFVTGTDLQGFETPEELQSSNLPLQIKEGITCAVCHSFTGLSSTYFANDELHPSVEYHMYPGENVYFGPMENVNDNMYHASVYSPMFKRSEMCLPCHDLVMRDVEAEITFTEWNRIPGFAMSGGVPCQECHMPQKEDGTHDHSFIGVDLDLSYPLGQAPQHNAVKEMLENSVELEFGAENYTLPTSVQGGDNLNIPITITSLTAHNLPSGTSFSREAWLQLIVTHNNDTLHSSGVVESNTDILNRYEDDLLLFTSYFLDENGDTTLSVTDTHDMINQTLPAMGFRYHMYSVDIPENIDSGDINIEITMRFRAFSPIILMGNHDELLENQPIFDMEILTTQIPVFGE